MSLDDDIALLASAPLIGLIDRDGLRLLAFAADKRRLRQGEALFRKGDRAECGYVVAEGEIGLDVEGGKPIVVARPGDLVGAASLFAETRRPATATARERTTVIRLTQPLMRRVLEEYPKAAAGIHAILAAELESLTRDLMRVGERMG
ncbi:cyclic nucleotide-binding domain-containing protein [Salinarimonas ramus]|uniref:Cyclic nucleotide-binding protein n=1 Tax=Salinarimonas ramus TaxID=690164 RepID=A0A917Q5K1_9HYPH|nr:Crp/Fnr family transcriptional regulator [Salinarimonas ramus]GGK26295.1 cyclic nucleotide-binding protein [Salinarimonas ramus]